MDKNLLKISAFDAADYLKSPEDMQEYLNEVISENDPAAFLQALNTIARARGMSYLARETGLARESLYQSLSPGGNPTYATLCKILSALNLKLHVVHA